MTSHELANKLLEYPDAPVAMILDVSRDEDTFDDRLISEGLECAVFEDGTRTVMLSFCDPSPNNPGMVLECDKFVHDQLEGKSNKE
jgi:hypothetical protein